MKEKILIVSPHCPGCEQIKELLTKLGAANKYKIVDVSTIEGMDFANRLGIEVVPNCAVIEGDGLKRTVRTCTENEFLELIKGE